MDAKYQTPFDRFQSEISRLMRVRHPGLSPSQLKLLVQSEWMKLSKEERREFFDDFDFEYADFGDGEIEAGMVTIKLQNESPTFNLWLESSLVRFLAHDCLDSPRQQRAF